MVVGTPPVSWLFLEQESDFAEWWADRGGRTDAAVPAWCLITASGAVKWGRKLEDYQEEIENAGKAVILFLERRRKQALPAPLKADLSAGTWRVWCHYGGNITLGASGGPKRRWRDWVGLEESAKDLVFGANTRIEPHPFSRGQKTFAWTHEIAEVKQACKAPSERIDWAKISSLLDRAWEKADSAAELEAQLRALAEALPTLLGADFVLRIQSEAVGADPFERAERAIAAYQSSGLSEYKPITASQLESLRDLKACREDVQERWRHLRAAVERHPKNTTGDLPRKLAAFADSIESYSKSYRLLSGTVTGRLRLNPPAPQKRHGA